MFAAAGCSVGFRYHHQKEVQVMLLSRTGGLAAVVAGCVLFSSPAWAQKTVEKAAEKTEAEKTADIVEQIALAAELTAFGRGELADATGLKDYKSAEALVAAGGILLRVHKQTAGKVKASDAKVVDDAGAAVAADGAANSFEHEAEALFDEARGLAKDKAAIEAQIKQASLIPERGAAGGPRVINRTIQSGKKHNIQIPFESNAPATVSMRGTGTTQFEILGPNGKVLWHSKGAWGFYNWHVGRGGGEKEITVRVINKGGPPVAYTITTN